MWIFLWFLSGALTAFIMEYYQIISAKKKEWSYTYTVEDLMTSLLLTLFGPGVAICAIILIAISIAESPYFIRFRTIHLWLMDFMKRPLIKRNFSKTE